LVGQGNNGKSTILQVWLDLLGRENVSHVPLECVGGEFRLVEMAGKLANLASDMNHVSKVEEGRLKQLVTGDPIQANRKGKSMVTLRPSARLVFAANDLPTIHDRSDGVWRRMIALPFLVDVRTKGVDRCRPQRLLGELPGIFNWAFEGAVRLHRQGEFTGCTVCADCVEQHRYQCDPVRQFVDEQLIREPGLSIAKGDAYREYERFCHDNGYVPKNEVNFAKDMQRIPGIGKSRPRDGRGRRPVFTGVGLCRNGYRRHLGDLPLGRDGYATAN
jgi:putative DNA primase/helicase